jgi:PAS domain S-box-containing protein
VKTWPLRAVSLGFAAALLALAGAVGLAWRSMNSLLEGPQNAARAQEFAAEVRTVTPLLQDVEIALRGFVLDGREDFLKPYRAAIGRVNARIVELQRLVSGSRRQSGLLEELERAVSERVALSDRAVALRSSSGPAAALAAISSSEWLRETREIRRILGRIENEGSQELATPEDAGAQLRHILVLLTVGALVPFLLLLAAFASFSRELRARSEAAEAARGQLAFTAAITDSLGEGVYAIDREGRLTLLNRAARRMLGWTEEELLGRDVHEAIHVLRPDGTSHPAVNCPLTAALRSGRKFRSSEDVFTRRDGTVFPVQVVASPFVVDERIIGAVVAFQDIAERRRTEDELVERAAQAVFGAAVGAALTKADTLSTALGECAEAMVRHLGAATASIWILSEKDNVLELQGSAWARRPLFGPEARVPVGEYRVGQIALDRKPALLDLTACPEREDDKDWARREGMTAFAGYPLVVEGRLVGVVAMFATRPLTESALNSLASVADEIALGIDRSRAGEALRASEARVRAVVDNMIEGLIIVNEKSIVCSMNPAAEKIFGYSSAELVGESLLRLVPGSLSDDPVRFLKEAQKRAINRVTQWEGRRKNGEVFPFELSLFEFRTAEGRHFAGCIRDISQTLEVEKLKKEFVSTVSHELRTPLTSIRGSLGLLAGGVLGKLPEEAAEVVAVAERNVVRLVRLINDILDLERFDTGRIEMRFERVPLAAVFARSLEAVRSFADQEGVSLVAQETDSEVWADPDRIVQVLVNLLSNAVKFSPRRGAVELDASSDGGWAEVRVRDRGRGVPASHRDVIFERFRQVEASDAREKGGSGLGLAICKAIVERHGGEIGVESEEGKGSVFWFRVPVSPSEEAGGTQPVGPCPCVLLAEDDLALRRVLERQLRETGVSVRAVSTGEKAIVEACERPPDLLVLDVSLPRGNGFEVVSALRQNPRASRLPVLVYTIHDLTAAERERLTLGPTRFLTKSRATDEEFCGVVLEMVSRAAEVARSA